MTTSQTTKAEKSRHMAGYLARALAGTLVIGLVMFLAAGRLAWVNGWVYVAWYLLMSVLSMLVTDPSLLSERSRGMRSPGQKTWDRAVLGLYGAVTALVVPLIAALNFRFGWPPAVALWLQLAVAGVYALGWGLHLWAMAANRYFSQVARIQDDRGQSVVTAGPYRFVRHPGYVGGILLTPAAALLLGSAWAMIPGALGALLLVVRTALEDRMLRRELPGYSAYAQRVRYRLLPGIW